jgi:hypothetical protein
MIASLLNFLPLAGQFGLLDTLFFFFFVGLISRRSGGTEEVKCNLNAFAPFVYIFLFR